MNVINKLDFSSLRLLTLGLIITTQGFLYSCGGKKEVIHDSDTKPRVIVTTDGEVDDKCSFIRFLLYTCDFDVQGLVYTNSKWHIEGNGTEWMHEIIDAYAQVYPNLLVHNSEYPTPEYLKSVIRVGQLISIGREAVGEEMDTPGSDYIVSVLLDDDPRPVWLQAWGGLNNIAQAFYRIKASHPEKVDFVSNKAIVYAIAEQDDLKNWMAEEMPQVKYILNQPQFWRVIAYNGDRLNPIMDHKVYTKEWVEQNVKRGSLGLLYQREFQEEGDSPAFFHLMSTGLRSFKDPTWGGWGGRFERVSSEHKLYRDAADDGDTLKPLWRWIVSISEDFAARMDWTVQSAYEEANHAPVVMLAHDEDLTVSPGQTITLDASPTYDPDGNTLTYNWWQYREPGTFPDEVQVVNPSNPVASFTVPQGNPGQTIHIICEVRDDARLPMTRYRRVVATFAQN